MAQKQTSKKGTGAPSKNTFAETVFKIGYRFSIASVFDDFLTMAIAACTQNLETKKSWYEDEYLATIAKYKDSDLRHEFPLAFAYLITEMEDRLERSLGNDVLGDFFEQHISNGRNGQFFTPDPLCQFMAAVQHTDHESEPSTAPLRILDPACGSGRMLLASRRIHGTNNEFYGIDIDGTCVKMAALNLFLNGVWNSEVMCANALSPSDFVISYHISFMPLGIFKIEDKEKSRLWHLQQRSFETAGKNKPSDDITLSNAPFKDRPRDDSVQLDLF